MAQEEIEECIGREEESFVVWPENWPAVETFCALSTQWRYAGSAGSRAGLDYSAIRPVAEMLGHEAGRDLFDRLRIMEGVALEEFARQRDRR